MTALPSKMYRSPLDVLLEAEAETCKGCMHLKTGMGVKPYCGNPDSPQLVADQRCDEYEETDK